MVVINMLSAAASITAAGSMSNLGPKFGNGRPHYSRLAVSLADARDAMCDLLPRHIAEPPLLVRCGQKKLAGVIGFSLQDVLNVPERLCVQSARAGQDPGELTRRLPNNSPSVIWIEANDPVVAGRWPHPKTRHLEEGHLQPTVRRVVQKPSPCLRFLARSVSRLTGVHDLYQTVFPHCVVRRRVRHTVALKPGGNCGHLMPLAKITLYFKVGDRAYGSG